MESIHGPTNINCEEVTVVLFYPTSSLQSDKSLSGGHVFYNFELYCTTRTITLVNLKRVVAYCIGESQFNSLKKKKSIREN